MELNDAIRRTIGQHRRLLAVCLLAGVALALAFAPHGKEYSASARLVLDMPDPIARQQSEAYADTAKAIATSPSQVSAALHRAGVRRGDPAKFAQKHVSVTALGSSGVIQLTVSDRDARSAAAIARLPRPAEERARVGTRQPGRGERTAPAGVGHQRRDGADHARGVPPG